jgi:hypothetical protein
MHCSTMTTWLLALSGLYPQAVQENQILERADKLLEEAKAGYESAREKGSTSAFVDAGFKLEEARIKYFVLQEIGTPEKQKIAGERLRAVNQLGKLIHDGKVAVTPRPPDAPNPPPATPEPAPKPSTAPATAKIDVTRRSPIPDLVKQRDAEKQIKELFKDQYAKKTPADRDELVRLLLEMAGKSQDDPAALWVLCREAQEVAGQNGNVRGSLQAVEAAARVFDVDGLAMKNVALTSAGKTIRTADDSAEVTEALMELADEFVRSDQYDPADKVAVAALQHARKANDPPMIDRVATRGKEIAEARTLFAGMKAVLETLARTPEDAPANAEMGKFLCFVKGNWDLGLRFMVKGSDPVLKGLAEREAEFPAPSADRISLADSWYDLADKEKSPLRKNQMLAHAQVLYEAGLSGTTALTRARIEKRLESLQNVARSGQPMRSASVELTALTPKRSAVWANELKVFHNTGEKPVLVFGKECLRYIYAHPPSTVVYDIPPGAKAFIAVGTKQNRVEPKVLGSWRYIVIVDGKVVFESRPLSEVKGFELNISVPLSPGAN